MFNALLPRPPARTERRAAGGAGVLRAGVREQERSESTRQGLRAVSVAADEGGGAEGASARARAAILECGSGRGGLEPFASTPFRALNRAPGKSAWRGPVGPGAGARAASSTPEAEDGGCHERGRHGQHTSIRARPSGRPFRAIDGARARSAQPRGEARVRHPRLQRPVVPHRDLWGGETCPVSTEGWTRHVHPTVTCAPPRVALGQARARSVAHDKCCHRLKRRRPPRRRGCEWTRAAASSCGGRYARARAGPARVRDVASCALAQSQPERG